jgi:hypothetical protein
VGIAKNRRRGRRVRILLQIWRRRERWSDEANELLSVVLSGPPAMVRQQFNSPHRKNSGMFSVMAHDRNASAFGFSMSFSFSELVIT